MLRTLIPVLAVAAVLFACTTKESKAPPEGKPASDVTGTDTGNEAVTDADASKVAFTLAKADALDGTTDHVVHKCAGCALGMDGKEANSLEVEGYTMHFCSGHCRDGFADGTADKVLALKVD